MTKTGLLHDATAQSEIGALTITPRSGTRSAEESREVRPFAGTARFQPRAQLGRGGMGVVYRVFDAEMGRDVALKTLPALAPAEMVRLKEEFRVLAGVTHPNLIELYELVVEGEEGFFTMELLDSQDFVAHVRGRRDRGADRTEAPRGAWLERLPGALAQLVHAVSALHRAGKLHRDIKPSNVQVTSTGRVVLLDLGLALALSGDGGQQSDAGEFLGTPEYMSPEQAWGMPLSTATDWYAVGTVLYESLSGRRPFAGTLTELIAAKSSLSVPRPAALVEGVPGALDDLTMTLLAPSALQRASGADILRVLREMGAPVAEDEAADTIAREAPFVGRDLEHAALRAAFDGSAGGGPVLVRVEGPSGMGKTELLRRFISEIEREHGAFVLRGRCHPQESVPYKAFDGLIDALSRSLDEHPVVHAPAFVLRHAGALLRIFPALAGLEALAAASMIEDAIEPQELRRRGFEALGELFTAIARDRRVVLWIDDLQWGDADSLLLLRELLLGTGAPLLFLVGYRSEDAAQSPLLSELGRVAAALPAGCSRHVLVAPLDEIPARALAAGVLGYRGSDDDAVISGLVAESGGSPYLLTELARDALRRTDSEVLEGPKVSRLARVVQSRIERLRPGERRLLEIVSTAGGPIDRSLALQIAGLGESGRPDVARLGQARLLRSTELEGHPAIETYHDRVREVLLTSLVPERRGLCHRELAEALRKLPAPDPEALLRHYEGAGDTREAASFALPAADRAASALAFDRAAELYRKAIELGADALPRWTLQERLAEALTNSGRGVEAAEAFRAAAGALAVIAPEHEALLDLRRRAAEQFLRCGHNEDGMAAMSAVLARVGVTLPSTPAKAMRTVLFARAKLLLRGLGFKPHDVRNVAPVALTRLDAIWSASTSLSMMNHTLADALGVQHLLEALDLGERSRVARALGYEASFEAAFGSGFFRRRSERMLRIVATLAHETGDPYDLAWSQMAVGTSAWLRAEWTRTVRHCDEAAAIYRQSCRGAAWELAITDLYGLSALSQLGRMRELDERLTRALREAIDRGNLFAANNYRIGQMSVVWLARDEPDHCLTLAEEAKASWRADNYHTQRYHHAIGLTQAALYRGDPWGAFRRITEEWPRLEAAQFLRLECPRVELLHLRARSALAAAASPRRGLPEGATPPDKGWDNARLVRLALSDARRIERDDLPIVKPFSALIRAGAARIEGDRDRAATALSIAVEAFDRADMAMYREAARMRRGALLGGEGGRALVAAGERWMVQEAIRRPGAMLEMLTPACGGAP